MIYLQNKTKIEKTYIISFFLFSFFSAIFCGFTRVNNIFHIATVFFIISLIINAPLRQSIINNKTLLYALTLVFLFSFYYAISNIWGGHASNFIPTITHGLYIIIYLSMLVITLNSPNRHALLGIIIAGITALSIYTIITDYSLLLHLRVVSDSNPGPNNVIDLGGYAAIGCLLSLIIFFECKKTVMLIPAAFLLLILLLTQSRGPLLSLIIALVATARYHIPSRKTVVSVVACIALFLLLIFCTPFGEQLITRFMEMQQQSTLRVSIWNHVFEQVGMHPWTGLGFNHELNFINFNGDHINTAHSIYLGALFKGGIIGFTFFSLILLYGMGCAWQRFRQNHRLECAIYIFALFFGMSQGMFVIANPTEPWYLLWFPLGLVLSSGYKKI